MFCDISDDSHQWLAHYDLKGSNQIDRWLKHFYYKETYFTPKAARRYWQKWGSPEDKAFFPRHAPYALFPYLYRDGKGV